jgi:Protein of unknown function (DUF3455)
VGEGNCFHCPDRVGAIPRLLLDVKTLEPRPDQRGGDTLSKTTFTQRLNTFGGSAPATGCDVPTDIGRKAFVPYTAGYFFYKASTTNVRDDNQSLSRQSAAGVACAKKVAAVNRPS